MLETIEKTEVTHLSDSVKNVKDAFGVHTKIAEALEQKILDSDLSDTGLTIGLFGEWGTGKSLIIDKLGEHINTRADISFINIDVWKYNGIPLLRHVLYEVAKQGPTTKFSKKDKEKLASETEVAIQVGTTIEKYKNPLYKKIEKWLPWAKVIAPILALASIVWNACPNVSNWLSTIASQITIPAVILVWCGDLVNKGVVQSFKSWFSSVSESIVVLDKTIVPTISPEQFEKEFDAILEKLQQRGVKKHVIIFDNIDRCKGDFAYEVLSTIKTYMCKENCVYIVPCDDVAVKHYLTNEYKHTDDTRPFYRDFATEFLDKLFNTYFRIPLVSEDSRDKYIEECLSHTSFSDSRYKSKIVSTLYYAYKGETPRQIKKYINDLISYYEVAVKVDTEKEFLVDDMWTFAVMVAIKQMAPDFEKELIENPDLIYNIDKVEVRNTQKEKVKELFAKLRYQFPQEKSVLSYVYFAKTDDEVLLSKATREGKTFDLDEKSAAIVTRLLLNDKHNEIFLQNDFNSVIASILKYGAVSFMQQKIFMKNFDYLFYALTDSLLAENGDKILLDCLEEQGDNLDFIADTFRVLGGLIANGEKKYILFEKFDEVSNYLVLYSFALTTDIINFNSEVKRYLEKIIEDKKLSLTDELYGFLSAISENKKHDYFTDAFIETISPLITHKDAKWRAWELDAISNSKSKLLFLKVSALTSKLTTIIADTGVKISTNTENAFEEIDYLNSFNNISAGILSQMAQNDPTHEIFTCFSTQLIALEELQERAQVSFSLAVKMFGELFLKKYFVAPAISYVNRVKYIESICTDEELLDIFINSRDFFKILTNEKEMFDTILSNASQSWKYKNIELFIENPLNVKTTGQFVSSARWSAEHKERIHKLISELCILSANEYADNKTPPINQMLDIIRFGLKLVENRVIFDASMSVFKKIADADFAAGISVYKVFVENNYQQKIYLDYLLDIVISKFQVTQEEIPEHGYLIAEIETHKEQIGIEKLFKIVEVCIEVANKKSVISIGLKALDICLNIKPALIDKYKVKLETIKSGSILIGEIDTLLETEHGEPNKA